MSGPVRVKICGLTRVPDVRAACRAGADALGFVFVPASKRWVSPERAAELVRAVPPFVERVGLFLDAEPEFVREVLAVVPLGLLQFHGREEAGFCSQFGLPYTKAVSAAQEPVKEAEAAFGNAAGILVDSHAPGGLGGTGHTVAWDAIRPGRLPLILAGGLNSANVAEAVRVVRPWAVDVSSGVETAPGIKDPDAIRRFIEEAKRVN
ncbi:phosphoribosylanthranilate isomerase [Elongatibacter sediminis]|uniref:N-(5'-phosphoribosyl)anthranilate isomerase n=1 Tax=Elongatibacter sediminis TaxID=3119006 RepID=A0AAW9RGG1_9GAMM